MKLLFWKSAFSPSANIFVHSPYFLTLFSHSKKLCLQCLQFSCLIFLFSLFFQRIKIFQYAIILSHGDIVLSHRDIVLSHRDNILSLRDILLFLRDILLNFCPVCPHTPCKSKSFINHLILNLLLLQGDEFGTMKTQGAALGARSFCPFYKKKSTASFNSGLWTSRIQFYKPKKLNLKT